MTELLRPGDKDWDDYGTRIYFDFEKFEAHITFRLDKFFPAGCNAEEVKWLQQHPDMVARLLFLVAAEMSIEEAAKWAQGYLSAMQDAYELVETPASGRA
jgi:hypothetical protein